MIRRELEPRMLTQAQAAQYCGMGVKAFKATCPVNVTQLRDGLCRFDRYKLDRWIDSLDTAEQSPADTDWLGKLYPESKDGGQRNPREGA